MSKKEPTKEPTKEELDAFIKDCYHEIALEHGRQFANSLAITITKKKENENENKD